MQPATEDIPILGGTRGCIRQAKPGHDALCRKRSLNGFQGCLIIGDTTSTGIPDGHQLCYYTLLVFIGMTHSEEFAFYSYWPKMELDLISDIHSYIIDEWLGQPTSSSD